MRSIELEGRAHACRVIERVALPADAPRLVVVSYLPNDAARGILEACLDGIAAFTPEAHVVWVVDNNSPAENVAWLEARDRVNLVLNRTEPAPPGRRGLLTRLTGGIRQRRWGSYANAVGVELALRVIDPAVRAVMTLHMDTLPLRAGWLSHLVARLSGRVAAAGVRMERARTKEGVVHVLGCLVDYQRVRELGLAWYPELPRHDVGDLVSVRLREAGYDVYACRNTRVDAGTTELLAPDSVWRRLDVEVALDDDGRPIFAHMGRGILKTVGGQARGLYPDGWVGFARDVISGRA